MNEAPSSGPAIDAVRAAELIEPLTDLVIQAGAAILAVNRQTMEIDGKADGSPVTEADMAADRIIGAVPWAQAKRAWPDELYYDPVVHDAQLLYLISKHFPDRASGVPASALEGIGAAISGNRVTSLSAAYTLLALDAYAKAAAPRVKFFSNS